MPFCNLSVGMCVRVCDIEFVVFTDCESCARPISTNPVSMEAGECGLTRGAWVFARRWSRSPAAVDSVVCFPWGGFFRAFHEFAFSNSVVDPEQPASNR